MPVDKLSVSLDPRTINEIDKRGEMRSPTINECLERFFAIMSAECRTLVNLLDDNETALIVDAFNGTAFYDTVSIRLASVTVADAIAIEHLDRKWDVDAERLMPKLDLSFAASCALVDAVNLWWTRVSNGENIQPTSKEVFTP